MRMKATKKLTMIIAIFAFFERPGDEDVSVRGMGVYVDRLVVDVDDGREVRAEEEEVVIEEEMEVINVESDIDAGIMGTITCSKVFPNGLEIQVEGFKLLYQ